MCVIFGARDAIRSKSRFGSISSHTAIRDDAMNRYQRVYPGFTNGDDSEKQDAMNQVGYVPVSYSVQRWELEQLVERELPAHLRPTALFAACGLTQEQSGTLQGMSARTVCNRMTEIRKLIDPQTNVYAVVCEALLSCLDKPRAAQSRLELVG